MHLYESRISPPLFREELHEVIDVIYYSGMVETHWTSHVW